MCIRDRAKAAEAAAEVAAEVAAVERVRQEAMRAADETERQRREEELERRREAGTRAVLEVVDVVIHQKVTFTVRTASDRPGPTSWSPVRLPCASRAPPWPSHHPAAPEPHPARPGRLHRRRGRQRARPDLRRRPDAYQPGDQGGRRGRAGHRAGGGACREHCPVARRPRRGLRLAAAHQQRQWRWRRRRRRWRRLQVAHPLQRDRRDPDHRPALVHWRLGRPRRRLQGDAVRCGRRAAEPQGRQAADDRGAHLLRWAARVERAALARARRHCARFPLRRVRRRGRPAFDRWLRATQGHNRRVLPPAAQPAG
eukprot:scaffold30281_cov63-Phaeocystis_antarctica.AAC.6